MVFPEEREVDRKEKVSFDAMELINSLLQEKEHRLSSKKYRFNDYQHSKHVPGQLMTRRADPAALDYQGNYVYPDDATDIKAHSFFRRISWDRLHLARPPFVPDVSGHDDTKYFDDEEPLSDVDDAASQSGMKGVSDEDIPDDVAFTAHVTQVDGFNGLDNASVGSRDEGAVRGKEKRRPRDRALRDKAVGRKVLELRKKGAFVGYTYRRPELVALSEERGRKRPTRRNVIPTFVSHFMGIIPFFISQINMNTVLHRFIAS